MKKNVKALAALFLASFAFLVTACNTDVKDTTPTDTTAPAKVSDITVSAANGKAVLTWTNPADDDFAGVKISMLPAAGTLANPITLDKGVNTLTVSGLTNGSEYTFTIQTFDESLNYSKGVSQTAIVVADTSDTTAPASVTNLVASAKDKSVLLTWTDAVDTDNDIYGYEVSWTSDTASRAVTALEANSMVVAQGVCGAIVRNLTNGTEYTFTVKTLDTSFNKSAEATATATPVENPSTDVLKIDLSVPETKSNTSVTVTANITTAGTVKKVVYKKDGSINPAKLLADSDAIEATADASDNTKCTFTISATDETSNGTYTVAAIDSDGREEIEQIAINNFDFTAPAKPKVASGVYSSDTSSITLNWTNPDDEDFDHVEIYYTTTDANGTSEKSTVESVTEANKTYSNIDAEKSYYTFYLASVDKLENKSGETTYTVRVNTPASDIPGFVKVPAASITGTETWTPSSETFVSGHALEIASFYMCDHEVTQSEFETIMGTNPSTATADGTAGNNPVNYVNWYAAIAYCNKLSVKEGLTPCYTISDITDWENLAYSSIPTSGNSTWNKATCDFTANGYRLPTEAEWEWAARGGENYTYAGSNTIDDVAWYTGNTKDS
jgi:formylglycine-generating enzyme required for sulfatase activity